MGNFLRLATKDKVWADASSITIEGGFLVGLTKRVNPELAKLFGCFCTLVSFRLLES